VSYASFFEMKEGYGKPALLGCQGLAARANQTSLSDEGFGGPDFISGPHEKISFNGNLLHGSDAKRKSL
jgi:hypothetical protein